MRKLAVVSGALAVGTVILAGQAIAAGSSR